MKNENLVIYRDVPVIITMRLFKSHKTNKRKMAVQRTYGDVPIAVFNGETKQFETVDNKRGYAYATRNARRFWKNKKEDV